MTSNINIPKNAKYIGYKCVVCQKKIDEDERQKIISLGFVQTWCMICLEIKYPSDKHLYSFIQSNGENKNILEKNRLLNNG